MAYTDKLRVVYGDYTLGVHGEGFDYIFSYAQGGLESIVKNGYEWLHRCPKPTFWRALTDNDRGSKFHIKSGSWLSADMFIDCKETQVIMDGEVQKPYAPDNNSFGGDVFADEIIVKYTYNYEEMTREELVQLCRNKDVMIETCIQSLKDKNKKMLCKKDIMDIYHCESDKALRILKLMFQMGYGNKIGKEYYVSSEFQEEFIKNIVGKEVFI